MRSIPNCRIANIRVRARGAGSLHPGVELIYDSLILDPTSPLCFGLWRTGVAVHDEIFGEPHRKTSLRSRSGGSSNSCWTWRDALRVLRADSSLVPVAVFRDGRHSTLVAEVCLAVADDVIASALEVNITLANRANLIVFAALLTLESLLAYFSVGGECCFATMIDNDGEGSILLEILLADHACGTLTFVAGANGDKIGAAGDSGGDPLADPVPILTVDAQVGRSVVLLLHSCVSLQQVAVQIRVVFVLGQVGWFVVDDDRIIQTAVDDAPDQMVETVGTCVDFVDQQSGSLIVAADVTERHGCGVAVVKGAGGGLVSLTVVEASIVKVGRLVCGRKCCGRGNFVGSWSVGCGRKIPAADVEVGSV